MESHGTPLESWQRQAGHLLPASHFPSQPDTPNKQVEKKPPGPSVSPRESHGLNEPFWKPHPAQAPGAASLQSAGSLRPLPRLQVAARRAGEAATGTRGTRPPHHAPARSPPPPRDYPPHPALGSGSAGDRAAARPPAPGPESGECALVARVGPGQRGGWRRDHSGRHPAQGTTDLQQGRPRLLPGRNIQNPVSDKGHRGERRDRRAWREVPDIPRCKLTVLLGPRVLPPRGRATRVALAAPRTRGGCPALGSASRSPKSNTLQVLWRQALPLGKLQLSPGESTGEGVQGPRTRLPAFLGVGGLGGARD